MMAVIKKTDIKKLDSDAAILVKIRELELSLLGLRAEGKVDQAYPMRKALARLKTAQTLLKKKNNAKITSHVASPAPTHAASIQKPGSQSRVAPGKTVPKSK